MLPAPPAPPPSDPPGTARGEVEWEADATAAQTMCYGQRNKNNPWLGSQALAWRLLALSAPPESHQMSYSGQPGPRTHATLPQGPQVLAMGETSEESGIEIVLGSS